MLHSLGWGRQSLACFLCFDDDKFFVFNEYGNFGEGRSREIKDELVRFARDNDWNCIWDYFFLKRNSVAHLHVFRPELEKMQFTIVAKLVLRGQWLVHTQKFSHGTLERAERAFQEVVEKGRPATLAAMDGTGPPVSGNTLA